MRKETPDVAEARRIRLRDRGLLDVVKAAAEARRVVLGEVLGTKRTKAVAAARHAAWLALHDEVGLSWSEVAAAWGVTWRQLNHVAAKARKLRRAGGEEAVDEGFRAGQQTNVLRAHARIEALEARVAELERVVTSLSRLG